MAERKVCVVTGSRADYGLLQWVMQEVRAHPCLELQIAVTGMHLSKRHGETWKVLEDDGFRIDARVDLGQKDDTLEAMTRAVGAGVSGFAGVWSGLQPDFVLVLGDRYEIFAAVQAAVLSKLAVAHVAGGDVTEGAIDDAMRHAMTKMAHLHFVTNEQAAARVIQMGEDPGHVHVTGSPGLDTLRQLRLLGRAELEEKLGMRFLPRILLVTFHPATLDEQSPTAQFAALLKALDTFCAAGDTSLVFTRPNSDPGSDGIADLLDAFVASREHARAFVSLGQLRYLSLMSHAAAVVGNSSSGLYEAPSLHVPTVNIGDRQKGRIVADSVIDCAADETAIGAALAVAMGRDCSRTVNPYGDGHSAPRIAALLADAPEPATLLRKKFHEAPLVN